MKSTLESLPGNNGLLETGLRVVSLEAKALDELARSLNSDFARAVDMISRTEGRVVVSGIGKSGHIGRKLAATLASTGQPAHFVHPAEASHGDLGMLAEDDTVIALSNSGETAELTDILSYTRRFGIPLIGIAGVADCSMIRLCDVGLVLPTVEEACRTGIVPTTSTTMMLALGDAMAISLMEHRRFTPEHFHRFHPGGSLGVKLSKVRDLMHCGEAIPLVRESSPMPDTLLVMTQKGFGVAGITDREGGLIGVITDGDLRRHMENLFDSVAGDVMTRNPVTISQDALAEEALALMNNRAVTCLFATVDPGGREVAGVLHVHDCLRAGIA